MIVIMTKVNTIDNQSHLLFSYYPSGLGLQI